MRTTQAAAGRDGTAPDIIKRDDEAERAALVRCGFRAAMAADGRGMRGARVECRNALVRLGRAPIDADQLACAMVRVGCAINSAAARVAA